MLCRTSLQGKVFFIFFCERFRAVSSASKRILRGFFKVGVAELQIVCHRDLRGIAELLHNDMDRILFGQLRLTA